MTDPSTIASLASPFAPPLSTAPGERRLWGELHGAAASLATANAACRHQGLTLVIAEDVQASARLEAEIGFFLVGSGLEVLTFPDWETLPYDVFSPLPELVSQRLLTLHRLADMRRGVLVAPISTLLQRLPPRLYLEAHTLQIARGDRLDPERFRRRLEQAGYRCVSQVVAHGEFAVRGSLLDLFPMGHATPFRLDLLDDTIDSIRVFDPDTQRSQDPVSAIRSLPAREIPLDEEGVARFRQAFRIAFAGDPKRSPIYREVSAGNAPGGVEYYLPLFYEHTSSLFDYLPEDTLALQWAGAREAAEGFLGQVTERYEQRRHDIERPLLPPPGLYLDIAEFNAAVRCLASVQLQTQEITERRRGFADIHLSLIHI